MKRRVYLRALEPDDYLKSHKWRNDPEIQDMVGGKKYFVSRENEKKWVERHTCNSDRIILAICLIENDKYIGNVNIEEFDYINRTCSVPIFIGDKSEWGKGYALEAKMLAHKFAFEERNLHRIMALILEENVPSILLHEKCGFRREGVLRDSVWKSGKYHNQIVMGLLKDDFDVAYADYCNSH